MNKALVHLWPYVVRDKIEEWQEVRPDVEQFVVRTEGRLVVVVLWLMQRTVASTKH